MEQYESDLLSAVNSCLVSIKESDLEVVKEGQCNASCIRESLVKLLKSSGYDAAVCSSKWHGDTKACGGMLDELLPLHLILHAWLQSQE